MSPVLLMTHPGKSSFKDTVRHDQPDLERSDNQFFSRNDSTMSELRSASAALWKVQYELKSQRYLQTWF